MFLRFLNFLPKFNKFKNRKYIFPQIVINIQQNIKKNLHSLLADPGKREIYINMRGKISG